MIISFGAQQNRRRAMNDDRGVTLNNASDYRANGLLTLALTLNPLVR